MRANLIKSSSAAGGRRSPKKLNTRPAGFFKDASNKQSEDATDENLFEDEMSIFWNKVNHQLKLHDDKFTSTPKKQRDDEKRNLDAKLSMLFKKSGRRPSLTAAGLAGLDKLKIPVRQSSFLSKFGEHIIMPAFVHNILERIPIIPPNHQRKLYWDMLLGVLIFYSVLIIPLRIGFVLELTSREELEEILVDCIFGADIILSFNTAVKGDDDKLVYDRSVIAKDYLTSWFSVDFFSTVPIDKIIKGMMDSESGGADDGQLKMIKLLRLIRLLKLTRLLKLGKFMKNVDMDSINPAAFGLFTLLTKIIFTGHLISCFWFFMSTDTIEKDPRDTDWATEFLGKNSTLNLQYATSFYWTIATMMAVGYGDVYAQNSAERIYSIFAQIVGAVSFGAMIATVNILVESSNPRGRAYKTHLDELKAYLNERSVPRNLSREIKAAFKYYMSKKSVFPERDLVMDLPQTLRSELVMAAYSVDIEKVVYLKGEDEGYISHLMLCMKPFTNPQGDVLLEFGDVADEVVFLMRGLVHMTTFNSHENEVLVGMVGEGGFFGDLGYRKKKPRVARYTSQNICQMLSISRENLDHANTVFPLSGKRFNDETDKRLVTFQSTMNCEEVLTSEGKKIKQKIFLDGKLVDIRDLSFGDGKVTVKTTLFEEKPLTPQESRHPVISIPSFNAGSPVLLNHPSPGVSDAVRASEQSTAGLGRISPIPILKQITGLNTSPEGSSSESPQPMIQRTNSFKTRRASLEKNVLGPVNLDGPGGRAMAKSPITAVEVADETPWDLLKRGIIIPTLPWKMKWDMFVGAMIIFSVVVVPYRLGFDLPQTTTSQITDFTIDAIFWLDLLMSFRCAYFDEEHDLLVTIPNDIAKNYLKGWFFIDFFSVFPIAEIVEYYLVQTGSDILPEFVGKSNDTENGSFGTGGRFLTELSSQSFELEGEKNGGNTLATFKLLKVVRLIRLMKLVRLLKLGTYLEKVEESLNLNPAAFELIKLLLQVTFIAHLFGCFFFFTSQQTTEVEDSWYYDINVHDRDTMDQYIASLYWAFTTMTTVGYGDVVAISIAEKWYSVVIMMLGATVFGYILANIATLMGQLNAREARVQARLKNITEYLTEKNIHKFLIKSIKSHIRYSLGQQSVFDEIGIVSKLPTTLSRKLFFHNNGEILKSICLFRHLKHTGIMMYVFQLLQPAQFSDGCFIFKQNSVPNDIFFVVGGKAEIVQQVYIDKDSHNESSSSSDDDEAQHSPKQKKKKNEEESLEQLHTSLHRNMGSVFDKNGLIDEEGEGKTKINVKCGDVRPGQVIGYLGVMSSTLNKHSCVARGFLTVYSLGVQDLAATSFENPFIAGQLQKALASCIHEQNEVFKQKAKRAKAKREAELKVTDSNLISQLSHVPNNRMVFLTPEKTGEGQVSAEPTNNQSSLSSTQFDFGEFQNEMKAEIGLSKEKSLVEGIRDSVVDTNNMVQMMLKNKKLTRGMGGAKIYIDNGGEGGDEFSDVGANDSDGNDGGDGSDKNDCDTRKGGIYSVDEEIHEGDNDGGEIKKKRAVVKIETVLEEDTTFANITTPKASDKPPGMGSTRGGEQMVGPPISGPQGGVPA